MLHLLLTYIRLCYLWPAILIVDVFFCVVSRVSLVFSTFSWVLENTMFKQNSGRKRGNIVWKYFSYEASAGKSRCTVEDCGSLITGKNATNLVNHLRSKHKDVAAELQMAQSVQRKDTELIAYFGDANASDHWCSLSYWLQHQAKPTSGTFGGRSSVRTCIAGVCWASFFSVCGDLCAGKRNRLTKGLEMRAFLKCNHKYYK